jgi:hypothetical protein
MAILVASERPIDRSGRRGSRPTRPPAVRTLQLSYRAKSDPTFAFTGPRDRRALRLSCRSIADMQSYLSLDIRDASATTEVQTRVRTRGLTLLCEGGVSFAQVAGRRVLHGLSSSIQLLDVIAKCRRKTKKILSPTRFYAIG